MPTPPVEPPQPPENAPEVEEPPKPAIEAHTQTSASDVKQYVDAAVDATERSRKVLIVLITASVLTLVATWNSRPASWFHERTRLVNAAFMLFDDKNQRRPADDPEIVKLRSRADGLYDRAVQFVEDRNITDRTLLAKSLERLEVLRYEQVAMVRMPFFGVGFDVNDLGIFAGFTFSVVLLWFRFSLVREVNNMRLTFHEARTQDESGGSGCERLRFCYDMLAMRQVLTTPKMQPLKQTGSKIERARMAFWIIISKSLFLLPLMAQVQVIRNDRNSIAIGNIVSPHNTSIVVDMSWVFLCMIAILTALCYYMVYKGHVTWDEAAAQLCLKGRGEEAGQRGARPALSSAS